MLKSCNNSHDAHATLLVRFTYKVWMVEMMLCTPAGMNLHQNSSTGNVLGKTRFYRLNRAIHHIYIILFCSAIPLPSVISVDISIEICTNPMPQWQRKDNRDNSCGSHMVMKILHKKKLLSFHRIANAFTRELSVPFIVFVGKGRIFFCSLDRCGMVCFK